MLDGRSVSGRRYDVAIVGAGPAGLSAAIELGRRGIRCLLIERNDRVGYAPRAKTTNVRTRTHLRRWGIADSLADHSPFGVDYPSDVHFVTRLAGRELACFRNAFNADPSRHPDYPEHAQWIPQYALERVLREHVATLPSVELRFNTEFIGCDKRGDGVCMTIASADDSSGEVVEATFLVGADGARSTVRDAIGATMSGAYGLSHNYNIVFRAPGLATAHLHAAGIMYWQVNADVPSIIGPMDRDDVWFFMPTGVDAPRSLSNAEAQELIKRATGIDADYQILSSDLWVASRLVADKYREGPVFLIGDACHLHPPFGGYGMNMGIADAVDIGWKLAAVLEGWGGQALLESYAIERKPVHEWMMDEAEANHAVLGNQLWTSGLEADDAKGEALRASVGERILKEKSREFRSLGAVLGYCYDPSPVIAVEPGDFQRDPQVYRPSSRPGCLAPHLWLDGEVSLYDVLGDGFTLLSRGADGDAARAEANTVNIPLKLVELPESAAERYPNKLTLVRPDQHVAWRGDVWKSGILSLVSGQAGSGHYVTKSSHGWARQ